MGMAIIHRQRSFVLKLLGDLFPHKLHWHRLHGPKSYGMPIVRSSLIRSDPWVYIALGEVCSWNRAPCIVHWSGGACAVHKMQLVNVRRLTSTFSATFFSPQTNNISKPINELTKRQRTERGTRIVCVWALAIRPIEAKRITSTNC